LAEVWVSKAISDPENPHYSETHIYSNWSGCC